MNRRGFLRRACGRLVWLVIGFVLCQVVLAVVIDTWLGNVRDPEYAAKLRHLRARLIESPERPLVLVLGSSRTAYGLEAGRLSRGKVNSQALVFNFALMGSGPTLELVTLRRLLADGIRPDWLFVEVVPNMFMDVDGRMMEERLVDGARYQAREIWRLRSYYQQPWRLYSAWGLGRALPCYRHQAELREELLPAGGSGATAIDAHGMDGHGWHPCYDRPNPEYSKALSAMTLDQNSDYGACAKLAPGPVRALEDLVSLCARYGIPVTLLRMPEGSAFRKLYTPPARAALAGLLERLRSQWSVSLVDGKEWAEDNNFWDTHHLLAEGARVFTERFGQEALRPTLRELSLSGKLGRVSNPAATRPN